MSDLGYIVIEWNQASGQPEVASDTYLYWTRESAEEFAAMMRSDTARTGRRERYTLARVEELDDE